MGVSLGRPSYRTETKAEQGSGILFLDLVCREDVLSPLDVRGEGVAAELADELARSSV